MNKNEVQISTKNQFKRKGIFPMYHLARDLIEALAEKQDIEDVFCCHLEANMKEVLKSYGA